MPETPQVDKPCEPRLDYQRRRGEPSSGEGYAALVDSQCVYPPRSHRMTRLARPRSAVLLAAAFFILASAALADPGMWLFTSPPVKILKERHGFEPDAKWLEHVQKSSVRFPN